MALLKKLLKVLAWVVCILLLVLVSFAAYVAYVTDVSPPQVADRSSLEWSRKEWNDSMYSLNENWLRKNEFGLYEMYVAGAPFERGVANGKLSKELLIKQEQAFTDQIKKMIPSESYLRFLKYVVGFMNRDLSDYVIDEYQKEIYGISFSASDRFQWIGTNYARQLNYHAAHDIGHALQNLMLVGCTSFGAWDAKTERGAMLLGRNFDFWVGDEFAENKIVEFVHPESGHDFAFVTWGGFIGVVSGMNTKGLTVTINAAKSKIPTGAATPVSLVAREILQYAATIKEAVAIAHKRKMFVSESFLIGSAADHRSVIIEKTPDTLAVYDPNGDEIVCTNHYQSRLLAHQELNEEQMAASASVYRYRRTQELLSENYPLTPAKIAGILRDYRGLHDEPIGLGNELAINQFIAHHSIIFMPDSLRMWVSTSPWQMGTFVCYDLRQVFNGESRDLRLPVADTIHNLPPDPFLQTTTFQNFLKFRDLRDRIADGEKVMAVPDFVALNPGFFGTYEAAGDYYMHHRQYRQAADAYSKALSLKVPTAAERERIESKKRSALQTRPLPS